MFDDPAREGVHLVGTILENVGQRRAQPLGALRKDQAELRQEAPDAVDAGGAIGLEAFSEPMHAQHRLLLDGFTGTRRIVGREAASQIAAASLASFLPVAPSLR
jgi:hypothetical protein